MISVSVDKVVVSNGAKLDVRMLKNNLHMLNQKLKPLNMEADLQQMLKLRPLLGKASTMVPFILVNNNGLPLMTQLLVLLLFQMVGSQLETK